MTSIQSVPLRERSHFDIQKDSKNVLGSSFTSDDALCPGCGTSAIREEGGLVVAFGQSFFHVDCFRCAKCHEKVTADTNLLLLSDGSPVCANCTYCCTICQQAIHDEAIMAGDDSFHAHCFKCKICKNRIDELTYARTSHGIYCMDCHNDRVARNRRHAQKKAEMATPGNGGSASYKPRSNDGRKLGQEIERMNTVVPNNTGSPRLHTRAVDDHPENLRVDMNGKLKPNHYVSDAFFPQHDNSTTQSAKRGSGDNQYAFHLSPNVVSRSMSTELERLRHGPQSLDEGARGGRRRSMDDSVRPLEVSLKQSDQPMAVRANEFPVPLTHVDDHHSLQLSLIDAKSSSLIPLPSNNSTTLLVSSPPLPLDETIAASRSQAQSAASFRQHEQSQAVANANPSLRTSTCQSCEMDDNTVVLNLAEISSPPNGISIREERSSTRSSDCRAYSETRLVPSETRTGRRSPPSVSEADVPHGIESEIDTGTDVTSVDSMNSQKQVLPPPKNTRDTSNTDASDIELDTSTTLYDSAANETESFPMARAPHTAYIAPALPPIRFSMNSADFADLLTSVSGLRIRDPRTQPKQNDSGMGQVSPKVPMKQSNELSHERLNDYTHPKVNSSTVERTADNDKRPDFAPSNEMDTAEPMSNNFSPRLDQQNPFNPNSPIRSSNRAEGPTPSDNDKQGEEVSSILLYLKNLLRDESEEGIHLDSKLTEALLRASKMQRDEFVELKERYDSVKRTSRQYMEGLTVAQAEYDRELKARRDVEAEVTRLRVLLSTQTARLTVLSNHDRRQEQKQKSVKDAHDNLVQLENDLSRLIVQRDIILTEVQELLNVKSSGTPSTSFIRTLTQTLDILKSQYQRDLVPLKQERQILARELADLKASRDALLEETAALNARNEELAILNQEYARRMDVLPSTSSKDLDYGRGSQEKSRSLPQQVANVATTPYSVNTSSYLNEEEFKSKGNQRADNDASTPSKKFKWPGYKGKDTSQTHNTNDPTKNKPHLEHNFTQMSILRFTRCDRCGDKMWGSQLRCTFCHMSIHIRCAANAHAPCIQNTIPIKDDHVASGPSMFGRDLGEQATADNPGGVYLVPLIVDKCIEAVETSALDYEGIYRKTGGASQSRLITQLFERGDYSAFDLRDSERFSDICSVTSVLKNYFRSLPVPLLTFDLYEDFISAAEIPDPTSKYQVLQQLVNKLPLAHYHTLQKLMIHLHCIHEHRDMNKMNARNLGVVFGPTLMKSRHPGAEFSDMAQKAHSVGWLVENARSIFSTSESQQ